MPNPAPPQLTEQGRTEVGLVCAKGDLEKWDELVEAMANVHATDDFQETALHLACTYNQLEMVKVLVKEAKMNLEATNYEGWTPLCCAMVWGHMSVAKYLLKCGANPNHVTTDGNTLLHLAAWYDALDPVDWLLSRGMRANVMNRFGMRPFDMARPGAVRRLLFTAMTQEAQEAAESAPMVMAMGTSSAWGAGGGTRSSFQPTRTTGMWA